LITVFGHAPEHAALHYLHAQGKVRRETDAAGVRRFVRT
jgi:hypothetical protein